MNCSYETLAAEYFPDSYKRYWPAARLGVTLNPLSDRSRSSSLRLRAAAISLKQVFDDLLTSSTPLCSAIGKVQPDRWNPHE